MVKAMKRTTTGAMRKIRSLWKKTCRKRLRSSMAVVVNDNPTSSGPQKKSMVKAMIFWR